MDLKKSGTAFFGHVKKWYGVFWGTYPVPKITLCYHIVTAKKG